MELLVFNFQESRLITAPNPNLCCSLGIAQDYVRQVSKWALLKIMLGKSLNVQYLILFSDSLPLLSLSPLLLLSLLASFFLSPSLASFSSIVS
jgi:hypothetical protein